MLLNPLFLHEYLWPIPLILQAFAYIGVLKKMNILAGYAFIPGGADYRITKKLYPHRRTFWRPFFVTVLLVLFAIYLNPFNGTAAVLGRIFIFVAVLVYEIFLLRLYQRLSKAFGHGRLFGLFMVLIPPLGLAILGLGKSRYLGDPVFEKKKDHGPVLRGLSHVGFAAVSLVEALVIVGAVGYITVQQYPPRFLVAMMHDDVLQGANEITGGSSIVAREKVLDDVDAQIAALPPSRDKFFADHSNDKDVVVLTYIIGSDLEDRVGFASANINQMIEATKRGSNLSFVVEAGGSNRWFTSGIKDRSYGRYLIKDGNLELVKELSWKTCMSEPDQLADFISWATETYPADRMMLTMWDHGGGLSSGYGMDALNKRESDDKSTLPLLSVSEICDAIEKSGKKFDVIGFDACLMQNIEVAAALEPYGDYLLASEEVEGGFGWFYTSAFGKLAENPGMPTEDFGREIVACFDPYNTKLNDGEPNTSATLSFVDLPLAKAAYDNMGDFFAQTEDAIKVDAKSFGNLSLAGSKSYAFTGDEQVDLVDFLERFDQLDYDDQVVSRDTIQAMIDSVKACVLYRNADSAEGVNGMAFSFPVKAAHVYTYDYKQLGNFSFDKQRSMLSNFFSIMVAQQKKELESLKSGEMNFNEVIQAATMSDLANEEWYIKGFENYEDTPALINIPLKEVENGYEIEAPEGLWEIIANEELVVYQKEGELLRYLGHDDLGAVDEKDHPLVAMDGTWVNVGGHLCCYEAGQPRETKNGTVFTGTTKARLNGSQNITIHIEWDPVAKEGDEPAAGHVVGYTFDNAFEGVEGFEGISEMFSDGTLSGLLSKGKEALQPGDNVEFMFDYYDDEGNVAKTEAYGSPLIVGKQEDVAVTDEALPAGDVEFGGRLVDIYQRVMTTERIEAHID